jgi:hypothetical protein
MFSTPYWRKSKKTTVSLLKVGKEDVLSFKFWGLLIMHVWGLLFFSLCTDSRLSWLVTTVFFNRQCTRWVNTLQFLF